MESQRIEAQERCVSRSEDHMRAKAKDSAQEPTQPPNFPLPSGHALHNHSAAGRMRLETPTGRSPQALNTLSSLLHPMQKPLRVHRHTSSPPRAAPRLLIIALAEPFFPSLNPSSYTSSLGLRRGCRLGTKYIQLVQGLC